MIEKFKSIENFAVFKTFDWDQSVLDKSKTPITFKKLNIIYGRNYSGKTTLSRIARAMELGVVDEKFKNPKFIVQFENGSEINQDDPRSHEEAIRVFNEDFVRDNLQFISDHDADINAFAILGKNNTDLESKILSLKNELGDATPEIETGLYLNLAHASKCLLSEREACAATERRLNDALTDKATKGTGSIKYQSQKYGDQNYNIGKLRKEIEIVRKEDFSPVTGEEIDAMEALLKEESRQNIASLDYPNIELKELIEEVRSLVTPEISHSSKISEFLNDSILNQWARKGYEIHVNKNTRCKFCDSDISASRWRELESHFNEELRKLEGSIDALLEKLKEARKKLEKRSTFQTSIFYSQFQPAVEALEKRAVKAVAAIQSILNVLLEALNKRKSDILSVQEFPLLEDCTIELRECYQEFENLKLKSNDYSAQLIEDQAKAKEKLRYAEVFNFISGIGYETKVKELDELKSKVSWAEELQKTILHNISESQQQIATLQRQLNDEEQGAIRVNELLNHYFGSPSLSLQTIEKKGVAAETHVRFEVVRNSEKAYHLSEGERSLLAFCYFIAKLEEVETVGVNPIVWIDDPISSLDGNHIYFVYSVINEHLHRKLSCKQIFISTHSLEFLKYLRRLPDARLKRDVSEQKTRCRFLMVERKEDESKLVPMPKYMQKYVTEFNYLFNQIYRCAKIVTPDDTSYLDLYCFANNARKFMEIYLYYAYPDDSSEMDKMEKFFGSRIPSILIDRLNNEGSHLGMFERGSTLIDHPEIQSCAKLILEKLMNHSEQYCALLRSIGEDAEADALESSPPGGTINTDGKLRSKAV